MRGLILKTLKLLAISCFTFIFAFCGFSQTPQTNLQKEAIEYLKKHEPDLEKTTDMMKQFNILQYLVQAAYFAGEIEKAKNYSETLVELAEKTKSQAGFGPSRVGLATHLSNIVLGRIAFDDGDIEKAKEHLLEAGKVTGNPPTLVSFGPDMSLAKLLVEKGEGETVIQYLDLCAGFWQMEKGRIAEWKNAIEKGEPPIFGSLLTTALSNWQYADKPVILNPAKP